MKRKSGNEEFESNGREKGVENKTQHNTTQHEEDGDQERKKAALSRSHPPAREYARIFFLLMSFACERLSRLHGSMAPKQGQGTAVVGDCLSVFLFAMLALLARYDFQMRGRLRDRGRGVVSVHPRTHLAAPLLEDGERVRGVALGCSSGRSDKPTSHQPSAIP
jgi:hypothetical protein